MIKPTVLNRRIASSESELWMELATRSEGWRPQEKDKDLVKDFLALGNGICFVTSIDENLIGGTAVYVDKNRLGMALVDVIMAEDFREQSLYALIKSSLPFFRSVSIRDIDAITPVTKNPYPRFPLGIEIPLWTRPALEQIGFKQKMNLLKAVVHRFPEETVKQELKWSQVDDLASIKEFVWDINSLQDLDCSQLWYDLHLASKTNALYTASQGGSMNAIMSFRKRNEEAYVGSFLHNDTISSKTMAQSIVSMSIDSGAVEAFLPLVGVPQRPVLEAMAAEFGCSLDIGDTILMRKLL